MKLLDQIRKALSGEKLGQGVDGAMPGSRSADGGGEGTGLLGEVRVGMQVLDESGQPFGTIVEVSHPDPAGSGASVSDWAAEASYTGRDDLDDEEKARFLTHGYVRVDRDRVPGEQLIPADLITSVSGDTVRLRFAPD
jgi:hypothetical protein